MSSTLFCLLAGILPFGAQAPLANWINQPAQAQRRPAREHRWDPSIYHPALDAGVWHSGDAVIHLRDAGEHFVEVMLTSPDGFKHSFLLQSGGATLDSRFQSSPDPERLREKSEAANISLLGWVSGPATLVVKSDSPRYQLLAFRWTPAAEFDAELAPRWLDRARYLHAHALFEGQDHGPKARAPYLEQLNERLVLSRRPAIHAEASLGLARAIYWQAAENHEPRDYRRLDLALRQCLKAGAHPLVRQMIATACAGTATGGRAMLQGDLCLNPLAVPWSQEIAEPHPGAPAWAVAQRALKRRLEAIARWWVETRQQPNGELGGAWDDDVEILRSWGPLAFGLGSPVAARGLERLANGVWNSHQLLHGYNAKIRDVEHSAEPTTDTQPLLAVLRPHDPAILARLQLTARCAANWIARQPDGFYRFSGAWFNCRQFDPAPARAVDVHMNVRAIGPALWFAYLTRDPGTTALLTRWAESWVRAMRSAAHGKPAGRFPSAVWSRDGSFPVNSTDWDRPNAEWDYFQWSGKSQETLTSLILAAFELTGDKQWLDAATESFSNPDPRFRQSPEAFYHWRRLSGDSRLDSFFLYRPDPDPQTILDAMASSAREMESRLSTNYEMFTSEVLYTDRVYCPLTPEYRQRLFGGETPRGDRFPSFAVTWVPGETEYARAVLASTAQSIRVRLYSFQDQPAVARFHAWHLRPGRYNWRAGASQGVLTVAEHPQLIEIPLPPLREVQLEITSADQQDGAATSR